MRIARRPQRGDRLDAAHRLAEDDLTTFRERLDAMQHRLGGAVVAATVAEHHRAALAAHRLAEGRLRAAAAPDDLVAAVGVIAAGRQRLAHVEAYVTADQPPADRPPCLFDPAHGPSVVDATWTSVRYGTRRVPVCLQDTALLAAGVPPDCRRVAVEGRTVAYWEAWDVAAPYLLGYFPGHPLLVWLRDRGTRLPGIVVQPPGATRYLDTLG